MTLLFLYLSAVLTLIGTVLAVWALVRTWRSHSNGRPVVPLIGGAVGFLRRLLPSRSSPGSTATVALSGTASTGVTARGHRVVTADESLADQVSYLRERLQEMQKDLFEVRDGAAWASQEIRDEVADVRQTTSESAARLKALAQDIAVDGVRLQIGSLLFIGAGALCGLVPGFLDLV